MGSSELDPTNFFTSDKKKGVQFEYPKKATLGDYGTYIIGATVRRRIGGNWVKNLVESKTSVVLQ